MRTDSAELLGGTGEWGKKSTQGGEEGQRERLGLRVRGCMGTRVWGKGERGERDREDGRKRGLKHRFVYIKGGREVYSWAHVNG
jgi:hypothetical protein